MLRVISAVFFVAGLCLSSGACTSLQTADYATSDTNEGFNRGSYQVSDWVDRNALAPVARGYSKITPSWWRVGIANAFANLRSIDSALNGFLQGKPKRGATDVGRLLINTTLGIGGLIDVAQRAGLQPGQEDFGQTLAVWGYKKSRYVYVPFLGPTTVRDLPVVVVNSVLPRLILGQGYDVWVGGLDLINGRAQLLSLSDTRDATALDPYAFTREAYFQRRKFLIFDGDPPVDDFFDEEFEEFDE